MSSPINDQIRPIIIDFGSSITRIGFAGDDFPDIIAPSVYVDSSDYIFTSDAIDGLEDIYIDDNEHTYLVGHDALKYQNILKIHEEKCLRKHKPMLSYVYVNKRRDHGDPTRF